MDIHIGQKIKKTAKSKDIGATELAKAIKKSRPNVTNIFTRKTIDIDLLFAISKALNFNFFEIYSEQLKLETGLEHALTQGNSKDDLAQKLEVQNKNAVLQYKYITLLEEKNETLQKKIEALQNQLKAKEVKEKQ